MAFGSMFHLTGQVALITGGSRGLGLQMAEALGEMGARIAISARRPDELAAAAAHLAGLGIDCLTVPCDLQQGEAAVTGLIDAVLARFGALDILINNAGTSWAAATADHPLAAWQKVMNLNVTALFLLCREVGRRVMIPQQRGKILNIASIGGLSGNAPALGMTTLAYNTSKAAVINLTRALAVEWGPHNINVNALCPGWFPSKMSQGALASIEATALADIPLGRFGGPEDLKGPAVFLVSEAARHITGQALAVDGGATAG